MEFDKRLDSAFLNELYHGDTVHAAAVFGTFLVEVEGMMNACHAAIEVGDVPAFQKSVHKLKPTLWYVGLTTVGQQLNRLEKACEEGTAIAELQLLYQQITQEVNILLPVIKTEKDKLSALTINTR